MRSSPEETKARWDSFFYHIAIAVADNSRCHSRHIGAAIGRGKFLVVTGYNGPPIGISHCEPCPRKEYKSGEGLHLCRAAHAEQNAIAIAARLGHSIEGCTMYLTCPIPCRECAKSIINSGIIEVVVPELACYDSGGITGLMLLQEAGVIVREYLTNRRKCDSI